ncbi:MAG: hypothetical protein AABW89_02610 [Nanoarchaeota archaeon]
MTLQKPTFNVSSDGKTVSVDGRTFLLESLALTSRVSDLDDDPRLSRSFLAGPLRDQLRLLHSAVLNKDSPQAREIIDSAQHKLLFGRTMAYDSEDSVYAFEIPRLTIGFVDDFEGALKQNFDEGFGGREWTKGIEVNKDGTIRRISRDKPLSIDQIVLLVTGDEGAIDRLKEINQYSQDTEEPPYVSINEFWNQGTMPDYLWNSKKRRLTLPHFQIAQNGNVQLSCYESEDRLRHISLTYPCDFFREELSRKNSLPIE